jgi:hypothetical protein
LIATVLCLVLIIPGELTLTQESKAATAATGTRLITLGTAGGPLRQKKRAHFLNVSIVNESLYLIDAGEDVTRQVVQTSDFFRSTRYSTPRLYSDHAMGLPYSHRFKTAGGVAVIYRRQLVGPTR